jgi:hypothetical protein
MKLPRLRLQPLLLALTVINLGMFGYVVSHSGAQAAPNDDGILRGRGLVITDAKGKNRATIEMIGETKMPDGTVYPETVLLRLITPDGRPTVKLAATGDGSGMSLADGKGLSYVQVLARGDKPEFNVVDKAGKKVTSLP